MGLIKSESALIPGPGAYSNTAEKLKAKAPAFCFGRSKRPPLSGKPSVVSPGPGDYKLPTKFANLPDFALPAKLAGNKFV